jgi:hypothetical protein
MQYQATTRGCNRYGLPSPQGNRTHKRSHTSGLTQAVSHKRSHTGGLTQAVSHRRSHTGGLTRPATRFFSRNILPIRRPLLFSSSFFYVGCLSFHRRFNLRLVRFSRADFPHSSMKTSLLHRLIVILFLIVGCTTPAFAVVTNPPPGGILVNAIRATAAPKKPHVVDNISLIESNGPAMTRKSALRMTAPWQTTV